MTKDEARVKFAAMRHRAINYRAALPRRGRNETSEEQLNFETDRHMLRGLARGHKIYGFASKHCRKRLAHLITSIPDTF